MVHDDFSGVEISIARCVAEMVGVSPASQKLSHYSGPLRCYLDRFVWYEKAYVRSRSAPNFL
jgi:hypothetical protein